MAQEKAILAGGCFWGMQDLICQLDGVQTTRVGYTGGDVDRQGNDKGLSCRSEIFYTNQDQKAMALKTIEGVNALGLWPASVVTKVTEASDFWPAEIEHQDYLERIPNGYTCHFPRVDWVLQNSSS